MNCRRTGVIDWTAYKKQSWNVPTNFEWRVHCQSSIAPFDLTIRQTSWNNWTKRAAQVLNMFDRAIQTYTRDHFTKLGIDLKLNTRVKAVPPRLSGSIHRSFVVLPTPRPILDIKVPNGHWSVSRLGSIQNAKVGYKFYRGLTSQPKFAILDITKIGQ